MGFSSPAHLPTGEDINIDRSHSRTMNPDMALGSSLGLNDTMAPGDSIGHPDQHGSSSSMAQTTPWPQVTVLVTEIAMA